MNENESLIPQKELQIARVGTREVSLVGWSARSAVHHLQEHLTMRRDGGPTMCDPGCMAKFMFSRNSPANRQRVVTNLQRLFYELLSRGMFLVKEYGVGKLRGRLIGFGIFSKEQSLQRQVAERQLNKMKRNNELKGDAYDRALRIIGMIESDAATR